MPTSSQARPLGVQISHMLKDRGTDVVFGIPGVHNQELYRGIEEAGITHILARNEQGAGFMADGYARASGFPGVCYVITGPGLCNIMNPIGQAYSDSIPMLVISSCLNRADLGMGRGRLHEMKDQEIAAGTVADWSLTAMDGESAYQLIDRALFEFTSARPRPKHIQVPIEVLEGNALPPTGDILHAPGLQPDSDQVKDIAQRLMASKKPLFVLGGGATHAIELPLVVQKSKALVFETYAGRGIIPPQYPLNYLATLPRPESADICAEADLVIVIGSQLSEVDLWREDLGASVPIIRVDIDPVELTRVPETEIAILCDADAFASALSATLGTMPDRADTDWSADTVRTTLAAWRAQADAERPNIVPLCDALHEVVPEDTMFFSDMTQFAYVAKEVYPMELPGHWHHPSGFGTLGYALPAAIGGKIGAPEKPVISINGDSGVQYNIQELATAVELGLTLPIIVWDNGKLKEIEDSMVGAQIAPNSVVARNPDFCKLAEAYGAKSAAPRTIADFKAAALSALKADGPTLIHITPETSKN